MTPSNRRVPGWALGVIVLGLLLIFAGWLIDGDRSPEAEVASHAAHQVLFRVPKLNCSGCERVVRGGLSQLDGVLRVEASHETRQAMVLYDPERIRPEAIRRALGRLGYDAVAMQPPVLKVSR